jgi:hypothetical protein
MGNGYMGLPAGWPLGDHHHAPPEAVERWNDWKFGIRIHWGYYSMIGGWCGHSLDVVWYNARTGGANPTGELHGYVSDERSSPAPRCSEPDRDTHTNLPRQEPSLIIY